MYKNLLVVFVVMVFSSLAQAAGALAIDENQGNQYGFAYDYASISEASDRALSECGGNCSVVQVFESGCAAYAADQTAGIRLPVQSQWFLVHRFGSQGSPSSQARVR